MILNKPGEILEYESAIYTVGSWVRYNNTSNYAGLIGRIYEIRYKETGLDNQEPKIYCSCLNPDDINLVDKVTVAPCEIQSLFKEPPCYIPEKNTPYPLCIGNDKAGCECCIYFKNLTGEPNVNEQKVIISNVSLTPEEFKIMEQRLAKLDLFLADHNRTALISRPKTTEKVVYRVVCGDLISKRDAFILKIEYYLKDFLTKINIQ